MAYAVLPYGGVYITNSIAMNNSTFFTTAAFFNQLFDCQNQALKEVLQEVPMFLITDPKINIYGAAQYLMQAKQ